MVAIGTRRPAGLHCWKEHFFGRRLNSGEDLNQNQDVSGIHPNHHGMIVGGLKFNKESKKMVVNANPYLAGYEIRCMGSG